MARVIRLPAAAAAVGALFLHEAAGVSLFQRSTGSQRSSSDACTCLNWKDAYKKHNVTCGQGLEFFHIRSKVVGSATKEPLPADDENLIMLREKMKKRYEFCDGLYELVDANHCALEQWLQKSTLGDRSWCYVSKECQEVGEGFPVPGTDLSWKSCSRYKGDKLLADVPFADLLKMAQAFDIEEYHFIGLAYPYIDKDYAELKKHDIEAIKRTNLSVYIWPWSDHELATRSRWIVQGDNLATQVLNQGKWNYHFEDKML